MYIVNVAISGTNFFAIVWFFFMTVLLLAFLSCITQYCNTPLSCILSIYIYISHILFPYNTQANLIWPASFFIMDSFFLWVDVQFSLYWSSLKYIHLLCAVESPNVITAFPSHHCPQNGFGFTSRHVEQNNKKPLKIVSMHCCLQIH